METTIVNYYEYGGIKDIFYIKNDQLHRWDGPASIQYSRSGEVIYEGYWFLGEKYRSVEELQREVKLSNII